MKKLISNTEYGFHIRSLEVNDHKKLELRENYDLFLKKPLTLGMFVPCDENENVLEEPKSSAIETSEGICGYSINIKEVDEYQKAKDRVFFEGFIISENSGNVILTNGRTSILFSIRKLIKHIESNQYLEKIEDLVKYNLQVTPTAHG